MPVMTRINRLIGEEIRSRPGEPRFFCISVRDRRIRAIPKLPSLFNKLSPPALTVAHAAISSAFLCCI